MTDSCLRKMVGRRKNKCFEELGFILVKGSRRDYSAMCTVCLKHLKNTASSRLQSHRNVCQREHSKSNGSSRSRSLSPSSSKPSEILRLSDNEHSNFEETTVTQDWERMELEVMTDGSLSVKSITPSTNSVSSSRSIHDETSSSSTNAFHLLNKAASEAGTSKDKPHKPDSTVSSRRGQQRKSKPSISERQCSIATFMDKLSDGEEQELNDLLAKFLFGCNIPFTAIESVHFKNLIKKLRPAYVDKLPSRKNLSTKLLDSLYERSITEARGYLNSESVLIIDGWKNSSSNAKTVVCMLHNSNGNQAFLNAWDLSGLPENADKVSEIVLSSIQVAKEMYNTSVYAVVSDNASVMVKMGHNLKQKVWHSTCSSHIGNLLAKSVLNKEDCNKVTNILKEFKHVDLEAKIIEIGGRRLKLPSTTRWCSYRDSYVCLLENLQYMKLVAAESKKKQISQNTMHLIFNDTFIDTVRESVELFNPICQLINACQAATCSIADAADQWLNLELPDPFQKKFEAELRIRKDMALNVYALSAFYLHPHYDNNKLNQEQKGKINLFLLRYLSADGIEDLDSFTLKNGVFKILYEKNVKKTLVFWNAAKIQHPNLAQLALKLLLIPASFAQLERIFSNWAQIHTPIRNRLTFDRSKKLIHVYYSLRLADVDSNITISHFVLNDADDHTFEEEGTEKF